MLTTPLWAVANDQKVYWEVWKYVWKCIENCKKCIKFTNVSSLVVQFFLLICTWQHEVAKHIDSQTIKIFDFGNSYMYRPQTPISNFCLGLLRKCYLSLSKKCPSLKPKSSWISLLSLDRFSLHGSFSNYFLWVIFFLSLKQN